MRKRPMQGGGYGGHKKRYGGHSGGSGGGHHGQHRSGQRRNWPQTRERYLAQARDAMAAGDRVLAESYLQHADHCWRMMLEEGSHRPRPQGAPGQPAADGNGAPPAEDFVPENTNALPSFITTPQQPQPVNPANIQNWEERDA